MTICPTTVIAACLALLPVLAAAFFPSGFRDWADRLSPTVRIIASCVVCLPYLLVACPAGNFRARWLALYVLLPIALCVLLWQARRGDPEQKGVWQDYLVLAVLGLAVDLRWFEGAWPAGFAIFNKILLLDVGIWGFVVLRRLEGVGFDLRLRMRDLGVGTREFLLYAPIAIAIGLGLGFLHAHAVWPPALRLAGMFLFTFFFIAVPEELFFRGWLQNLLERRIGRYPALLVTAALFGLSHFNKRAGYVGAWHFNWRYVLLAAIAGVFYGRAWRQERRVGASAITHACVDTVWSAWLR